MGVYIGYIEKKGYEPTIWFNFKPIAEVRGTQVYQLSSTDQEELLPDSEKRNINFAFSWNDTEDRRQMDNLFDEKSLAVFEFTLHDLQPNMKPNGERNQTGYKVQAIEMISAGKIRPLSSVGVYYAVRKADLISDFSNDAIVEITTPHIRAGEQVLIERDGFWAGPYEVGYREITSSFYIKPQIREAKYTVSGYNRVNLSLQELTSSEGYWGAPEIVWGIISPKKDCAPEQFDVITDEALITSFCDSLDNGATSGGVVRLDDVPTLLDRYEESVLSGSILTDEVRKNRLNRLVDLLTSEEDVDETLGTVTDFICDLLVKYQNSPNVEEWLQALLEKHPELIEKLKQSQAIAERMARLEQDLVELQQQRANLEREIEESRQRVEAIDQAAIREKKQQMLDMDAEYAASCARLETVKKALGISDDIAEMQRKHAAIKREVDYLESHKSHLMSDSDGLELQFQQLISRPHEKMVGIAFDGFMASKMLQAAAQWEAEEAAKYHKDLSTQVNSIPTADKTPEELISYLCDTIKVVRPTYDRNTIVNIAICLTQGFLTVFSGEPGCGKTSICNIMGEVLGLNKIAAAAGIDPQSADSVTRYIPVSVERGWTSKRDFIGYFNPLSKTFDKSNRRVYDALHQLDTEKRAGCCKLPYVILLDEANLSPMEYYWSDFMNICDDLGPQSTVNLGENHVFAVPETLHFVATINNDDTTHMLSPRLIDRAWVITLPQQYSATLSDDKIVPEQIEIISWVSLSNAFIPATSECLLSDEVKRSYDAVVAKLKERRFVVSPRIDRAIKRYWGAASKWFVMDETRTDPAIVALDYAVAQRLLPKIAGNGEVFEKWLEELRSICSNHDLNMSAKIIKDILDRGNQQMKYYRFFG